jgi:hypothetical protein
LALYIVLLVEGFTIAVFQLSGRPDTVFDRRILFLRRHPHHC